MTAKQNRPARGAATRLKIVTTAEKLFAAQGVSNVPLSMIVHKAGLKNVNAVHYHFGTKQGLLQAIVDRHLSCISQRRAGMLDTLAGREQHDIRDLVEALVLPIAQEMNAVDGGEEFIHINAELIALKTLSFYSAIDHPLRLTYENQLVLLFQAKLDHLPTVLVQKRMMLVGSLLYHGLSDHARMRRELESTNLLADDEVMICILVDSIVAILASPVSEHAQVLLQKY
jgi:AcrR family transcriptional regulator